MIEFGAVVEVADHVILVQDLDARAFRDVSRRHDRPGPCAEIDRRFGPSTSMRMATPLRFRTMSVTSSRTPAHGGKLVQHVVDLHRGDGRALQRRHQHAAQRVAERQAEATLERFGDDRRLARRIVARLDVKLRRLDQFLPVLVDHASPPFLFRGSHVQGHARGIKMTVAGHAVGAARN
jgi:hypothetical protein